MRNVYLFNPENDLAMACGSQRYDAPKSARRLAADLSLLPLWFAEQGGVVLLPLDVPADYQSAVRRFLQIDVSWLPVSAYSASSLPEDRFEPWGWSPALVGLLKSISTTYPLVDVPDMQILRKWSSRERTIDVLLRMKESEHLPKSFPIPVSCRSLEDLSSQISNWEGHCLLKAPWSGSGKGLHWLKNGWDTAAAGWCKNILRKQQCVLCEFRFEKVVNFAMEFSSEEDNVRFRGYSLFNTDDSGTYRSNVLASDNYIESVLSAYVDKSTLQDVRSSLIAILQKEMSPCYSGFLGVDMMVCRSADGSFFVHPCVEINLRYNMGIVTRLLFDRYFDGKVVGEYRVVHASDASGLRSEAESLRLSHPLRLSQGKILSGFLLLTYINDDSEYMAYCLV